jgi:hypothetical protein
MHSDDVDTATLTSAGTLKADDRFCAAISKAAGHQQTVSNTACSGLDECGLMVISTAAADHPMHCVNAALTQRGSVSVKRAGFGAPKLLPLTDISLRLAK